jgi:hypothetical protein
MIERERVLGLFPDPVYRLEEFARLRKVHVRSLERAAARGLLTVHQDAPRGPRYVTREGIADYLERTMIREDDDGQE